jgi:hypothetical protein
MFDAVYEGKLTMNKWNVYLIKWVPQMQGDLLALWIKTLRLVELMEASVDASVPGRAFDFLNELDGRQSEQCGILHAKTFSARWISMRDCPTWVKVLCWAKK